jgi:hypothetical protein
MPSGKGRSTVDSIRRVRTRLLRLAFIAALVMFLTGTQAGADVAFEDAAGDQRNMDDLVAPDITSVGISNTPNGVITFQVTIANHTTLPPRSRIAVLFDIDRQQSTGFIGFEYAFSHEIDDAGQANLKFERWDEPNLEFDVLPNTGIVSEFSNGVYTFRIPRGRLQNTILFDFGMYAAALNLAAPNKSAVDDAPNTELWNYELAGLPAPRLSTRRLLASPTRPVAGRPFTVQAVVRRSDSGETVTSGSVSCTARVGTTRLRARGGFDGDRAQCVVPVPRTAKGKTLRGTLTVRAVGASVSRPFTYRIR